MTVSRGQRVLASLRSISSVRRYFHTAAQAFTFTPHFADRTTWPESLRELRDDLSASFRTGERVRKSE